MLCLSAPAAAFKVATAAAAAEDCFEVSGAMGVGGESSTPPVLVPKAGTPVTYL